MIKVAKGFCVMASGNKSQNRAKQTKEDEFYTQIGDIENELMHYKEHFKGKTIFCNCDDPQESNFWKYFELNFVHLGLKKLIATHYDREKPTYKLELIGDINGDGEINGYDIVKTDLMQNGDFRSPESVEMLKEADIVVTNPPFSMFIEYILQLLAYKKKFLIVGNVMKAADKDIFPHIQNGDIWFGVNAGDMAFRVPEYYPERASRFWIDENGVKWRSFGNMCWYTNIDNKRKHQELVMYEVFEDDKFNKYENYDAIDVTPYTRIPLDYYGEMGIPVTALCKISPDQFSIIGNSDQLAEPIIISGKKHSGRFYINDNGQFKRQQDRIIIKRKVQ